MDLQGIPHSVGYSAHLSDIVFIVVPSVVKLQGLVELPGVFDECPSCDESQSPVELLVILWDDVEELAILAHCFFLVLGLNCLKIMLYESQVVYRRIHACDLIQIVAIVN